MAADFFTAEEWRHMEAVDKRFHALHRIGLVFHNWMDFGSIFLEVQSRAMFVAQSNSPVGRQYNIARESIIAALKPRLQTICAIDPGDRTLAVKIAKRRDDVIAWWDKLEPKRKERTNHPSTVIRGFNKGRLPDDQISISDRQRPSSDGRRKATVRERTEEAENENERLRERMAELESEILTKNDEIAELKAENSRLRAQNEELKTARLPSRSKSKSSR